MKTTTTESNWSEARLQAECFQWHYNAFPQERGLLFTVDNNATDSVKGNVRKAMGRIAGVSDMLYIHGGRLTCIEMKLPDGRQSRDQRDWQQLVERQGVRYVIIRSLEEFQRLITWIREQATV